MALQGTIQDFALPDIFQLIGIQRKTGILTLANGREEVAVKFLEGSVVGAETGKGGVEERLGQGAVYAFVYPNLMLNRYGPILDTNWAIPLGPERTLTVFDYWFEQTEGDEAQRFIEASLEASDQVQEEDVDICREVQRGLASRTYDRGIYASVETAMHHFHCLLAEDLASE